MRIRLTIIAALAILPVFLLSELPAQEEGTAERIGRQIDQGLEQLTEEVQEAWADVRKQVDELGVQGRVYGRLRRTKPLAEEPIDVEIENRDTAILTGRVANEKLREKALRLAKNTVGVRNVIDRLQIQPSRPTP